MRTMCLNVLEAFYRNDHLTIVAFRIRRRHQVFGAVWTFIGMTPGSAWLPHGADPYT